MLLVFHLKGNQSIETRSIPLFIQILDISCPMAIQFKKSCRDLEPREGERKTRGKENMHGRGGLICARDNRFSLLTIRGSFFLVLKIEVRVGCQNCLLVPIFRAGGGEENQKDLSRLSTCDCRITQLTQKNASMFCLSAIEGRKSIGR